MVNVNPCLLEVLVDSLKVLWVLSVTELNGYPRQMCKPTAVVFTNCSFDLLESLVMLAGIFQRDCREEPVSCIELMFDTLHYQLRALLHTMFGRKQSQKIPPLAFLRIQINGPLREFDGYLIVSQEVRCDVGSSSQDFTGSLSRGVATELL